MSEFRRRILLSKKDDYDLIHWHSGEDALVGGKWMDRVRDIPGETPLDWTNYFCKWDAESKCYNRTSYEYMTIADSSGVVFGSDFRIEIEISALSFSPYPTPVDFGSVTAPPEGTCSLGLLFKKSDKVLLSNFKYKGNTLIYPATINFDLKSLPKSKLTFGVESISPINGITFIEFENDSAVSEEFPIISVGGTRPLNIPFFLFRGIAAGYEFDQGSIYDIKIYRKRS